MTLIDLQGHFGYFCLTVSVAYFSGPGDLTKDDVADYLEWPLEVVSGKLLQMYECTKSVTTVGRHMSAIINNFVFSVMTVNCNCNW